MTTYNRFTVECSRGRWAVFGWGIYPRSSPLEGKSMKVCVEAFDTPEEAIAAFPQALLDEEPQI
jgi:hypothetical protein